MRELSGDRARPDPAARLAAALETIRVLAKPTDAAALDDALETIRQLRGALRMRGRELYEGLAFTQDEGVILSMLMSDPGVSEHAILLDRLNLNSPRHTVHTANNLKVAMSKLRRKLAAYHIVIETVWGQGFAMTGENRERLRARKRSA